MAERRNFRPPGTTAKRIPPMPLNGKVALVTGASRGIGRAVAVKLGAMGATVAVHYASSNEAAADVVKEIEAADGRAFPIAADLGEPSAIETLVVELGRRVGDKREAFLDILVNNAGIVDRAPLADVSLASFERMIAVDLRAPLLLMQAALRVMRAGGRIVNVSSMVTRAAYPDHAVYAAAKAGLEALTLSLAPTFGARSITVNAVRPGATLTDMNPKLRDPGRAREVEKAVALGRIGTPDDIADVIAFLATDAARWITGQTIDASGGQRL